jgi:hypothetical protein
MNGRLRWPARGVPHGYNRYTAGCRCDICKAAKAAYMKARRDAAFLGRSTVPPGVRHGTRSTYEEHGCRCDSCRLSQVKRHDTGRHLEAARREAVGT